MKLGLRGRLFAVALGIVVAATALANWQLRPAFEAHMMGNLEREVSGRAQLVAALAEARRPVATDNEALARLAKDLAREAGVTVELVRADGVAIASSEGPTPSLTRAHAPDFMAARAAARGQGRPGFVVEGRSLYSAARFQLVDGSEAVARVGQSLAGVDKALAEFRAALIAGAVLLLALLVVAAAWMERLTARGLSELNGLARRMLEGDLEARSGFEGEEAVPQLGRTLDKLARGLSTSLRDLRSERDRMAGILEGMQEGVILLDSKQRIVVLNPALREMLLVPADAIGRPLLEVVRNAELRDLFAQAASEDEPTTQEVEIGNIKPRRLLARVARMPGEQRQFVAVFVDVTEVRRLESMRRDFVANVSHELRTPVTSIRSAAETLVDGALSDPAAAQSFVGIIDRNAARLQQLVEDLLDLSRIESRGFRLSFEPIDLKPIFSQVLGLFRERASKKNVALEEFVGDLPKVRADRRALEHVLTNLVDNAVKYCGPGTHVWLNVALSSDTVTVSVGDDGPGIDERHLSRVFERFYRVDAGRSREVGGTGLGLSIVKHLVEAMGGSVSVESQLNQGTTFSFTLKRSELEQESARAVA